MWDNKSASSLGLGAEEGDAAGMRARDELTIPRLPSQVLALVRHAPTPIPPGHPLLPEPDVPAMAGRGVRFLS